MLRRYGSCINCPKKPTKSLLRSAKFEINDTVDMRWCTMTTPVTSPRTVQSAASHLRHRRTYGVCDKTLYYRSKVV